MSEDLDRIRAIYERYADDPRVQARWDPQAPGNRENVARRDAALMQMYSRIGNLQEARVLEIGCGDGAGVVSLLTMGLRRENLTAVDFRESAVASVRGKFPGLKAEVADATHLQFPDASFDAVSLLTVFSSVPPSMQEQIAAEVRRLLRPGGAAVWYDMRVANPANPEVHPVSRARVEGLFPRFDGEFVSATLIPQLARHLPWRQALFPLLYALPFLRTHWLAVLKKPLG